MKTSIEYEKRPTLTLASLEACSAISGLAYPPFPRPFVRVCRRLYSHPQIPINFIHLCRLLLEVSRCLLEAEVALLVGSSCTETDADERGPRSSLEYKDGEDNTESEAESRLDEEIGKASVPLSSN